MVLRFLARLHGRLRRRFFRFTPIMRVVLAVFAVCAIVGIAELTLAWHYARSMPWYDETAQAYVAFKHDDRLFEHAAVVSDTVGQVSTVPTQELTILFDALKATRAQSYRLVVKGEQTVLYALGAQQGVGTLPSGWVATTLDGQRGIVVISDREPMRPPRFQWHWLSAMRLRALQSRFPVVLTLHMPDWPLFYGAVELSDAGWDMFLAPSSSPIRHAKLLQDTLMSSLATVQTTQTLSPAVMQLPFLSRIASPVWSALFVHPFRVSLWRGDLLAAQDPFAENSAWQVALTADQSQASAWLQTVLESLMIRFPLAEDRVLPDKTVVPELKRKADFFLTPGSTLDVAQQSEGLFTFPHDQISYRYDGDRLFADKGSVSAEAQTASTCQLPAPLAELWLSAQAMGTAMWKTLYFGLDKQKLAACIRW